MIRTLLAPLAPLALVLPCSLAIADEVLVAVAANFAAPMQRIATEFARDTGHKVLPAFGSTGKFHAQIRNGAPFEVLVAADDETPARLEKEGLAVAGSRFTYAVGRLALWSAKSGQPPEEALRKGTFRHLAIANPKLSPYGAAAVETLKSLKLFDETQPKFVQAENIGQAWQFVGSGNAELGFVALSQTMMEGRIGEHSAWVVPAHLHEPIRQDAILLARGRGRPAAEALMAYLKGDKAKSIIGSFGYDR